MALVAGIGAAAYLPPLNPFYCWLMGLVMLIQLRRRSLIALLLVIGFGLSLGWWRGSLYQTQLQQYRSYYYQNVSLSVRAAEDGVYGRNGQLTFTANSIGLPDGSRPAGKVQVSGFGLNAVFQGDELLVSGKLYPTVGAAQARLSFARLQLIKHHPSPINELRRNFAAGLYSALPEPQASFALGLLIGQRATLPEEVKQDLRMVGLTHIIAVSGYNLTIILHASSGLLAHRSKRLSLLLSLGLITAFLLLTGLSASIVRAAIVSTLAIWAGYYGRTFRPLNLIMLAAAITALANPFYVWTDAGWYLSFLAFYGVLVVAPAVMYRFRRHLKQSLLTIVAVESLCAEIMTLPYVLHVFGQMSFVGLLANVLVVALVPWAMLLSAVAGIGGMLWAGLAGWISWPATIVLSYILMTAQLLAGLPHAFADNLGFGFGWMILFYAMLVCWIQLMISRQKRRILL